MLLSQIAVGQSCRVEKVSLDEAVIRRFSALGMTRGTTLAVLERGFRGNLVIKLRGTRFAIGRPFAAGIEVSEASPQKSQNTPEVTVK